MFDSVRVGTRGASQVLVVGQFKGEKPDRAAAALDADGTIKRTAARAEATGELGAVAEGHFGKGDHERVLIVGLGDREGFNAGEGAARLRTASAAAGRRLSAIKATSARFEFAGVLGAGRGRSGKLDAETGGRAVGEALGLLSWTYDDLRGKATTRPTRAKLVVSSGDEAFAKGMRRGLGLAEGANLARRLSQTPPNIATPAWMAGEARALARKAGLKCSVMQGSKLAEERMEGLINVGKASENKPCLIRLEYTPARAKRGARPVVLVGKTMTYDSGGLSLKVNNGMKGMKRDKDGGCAVLGAMLNIATVVKPSVPVVALLAAAENAISDEAYRPDDVLTFRNGVTVEVTNTDAEGRLVLADALCWACEKEKPAAIIDMATLTGGVVIALGSVYAGLWCDDDRLRGAIERAATATGERVWRLPHHSEYNAMMKSPIADLVNSAPAREAHPIQGAAFLSYFVEKGIPWAHIDIAGTHATEKDSGPFIAGPTGYGARLAAEAVARLDDA